MTLTRPLVLSGFMATGKSTVGRRVADRLGVPFIDTDEVIARAAGATVPSLFQAEGEGRFRDREYETILPMLEDGTPRVISFGGGSVTMAKLRHAALERATLVTLEATPESIVARARTLAERPNLMARSPLDRTADLLRLRREAYAECHARIATDDVPPDALVDRVLDVAKRDLLAMPLGTRSYAIELGDGEPENLTAALEALRPSSLLVLTDENVQNARGAWLDRALGPLGVARHDIVIPPGEASKHLGTVSTLWEEALRRGVDRDAVVVAFGGGVVGDLAAFVASTLLRGVRCVQIATTLLAMVDSSVGGKTGFDTSAGKNLIGSFFQPSRVILDLEHLETLPARERACGLAEAVKIALACDRPLLASLEATASALAAGDRTALRPVVRDAVQAKIRVVRDDERETGARALLNLGHTLGHALESAGGYVRLLHGEAVAIGTVLEMRAAAHLGLAPPDLAGHAEDVLLRLGLPVRASRAEVEAAWPFVTSDKKRTGTAVRLPVVTAVGAAHIAKIALSDLHDAALAAADD